MLTNFTFLVLLLAVLYLVVSLRKPQIRRNGTKIRQPPYTLPIFGNAIKFLQSRDSLFKWFVACQKQYGQETLEISVPSLPPGVLISDPRNLEYVLKHEGLFAKGEFFRKRSWDLFGNGIINSDGDLWKLQRRAGAHFFSGSRLESIIEGVLPHAYNQTRQELKQVANTSQQIDLERCLLDLTTRVVGKVAYDMEIDVSSPFSAAFDYCSGKTGERFQNPMYLITELINGSKFQQSLAEVHDFGCEIITKAKEQQNTIAIEDLMKFEEAKYRNLLDMLVQTLEDDNLVRDAALNFLSAGRDTTAQSLTWTFYLLCRHPSCAKKLRREIIGMFPESMSKAHSVLPIGDLQPQNLPFAMAVFYESLRLRPPVPFELKQCTSSTILPDGTFLPKDSVVLWSIWAMNRSQHTWGLDAEEFFPERWLDQDGRFRSDSKSAFEFPVFHGGPRACLGKKMAELMAMYVIAMIVAEFHIEEVKPLANLDEERRTKNSLTLPMEGGFLCHIQVWEF